MLNLMNNLTTLEPRTPNLERKAKMTGFQSQDKGALAKRLAAEALDHDMSGWLVFDTNEKHPSTLKAAADEFLAKNVPSVVKL